MSDSPPDRRSNAFGHRRDVWGDDPEEAEASRVVQEFAADLDVQHGWHEHPAWAPFKVVWRFIRRSGRRIAVTVAGFAVVITGIILIPLPGPGWAIVFGGLAILATEYVWAQRLLNFAKRKAISAKNAVLRQKPAEEVSPEP
jgi:uncharacterized protein (TIGR02611 family)